MANICSTTLDILHLKQGVHVNSEQPYFGHEKKKERKTFNIVVLLTT